MLVFPDEARIQAALDPSLRARGALNYIADAQGRIMSRSAAAATLRTQKAYAFLLETSLPVGEVMARVAYANNSTFLKALRRIKGVNPKTLRAPGGPVDGVHDLAEFLRKSTRANNGIPPTGPSLTVRRSGARA